MTKHASEFKSFEVRMHDHILSWKVPESSQSLFAGGGGMIDRDGLLVNCSDEAFRISWRGRVFKLLLGVLKKTGFQNV